MNTSPNRQQTVGNRLLAALPPEDCDRLLPALEVVRLDLEDVLYEPGQLIPYVHFPVTCVIAVTVPMKSGATGEAGMVGREGMVFLCTFLESDTTPFRAVVQNPGEALRMKVKDFKAHVQRSVTLTSVLHRYADAFLTQVSYSAVCNRLHTVERRCCRWLLMTQDRAEPDHFTLTQEFLSQMLGVQRTSVTDAAHRLQQAGLIRYSRGKVTILDRPGLEAASCECYANIKAKFDAVPHNFTAASKTGDLGFGRLLENLPTAAYTCDHTGRITSFNQRAVELWGREPKLNDAVDRFCGSFKLFSPEGSPITHDQCWMALALREDKEYAGRKIVIERPDGSRRTALAHATPVHDKFGTICGGVNVLVDISASKQVEE